MTGKRGHRGWGHLRTLPSKRVQASFLGPDLVRYNAPHTFGTKMDAEAWLASQHRAISMGTWKPPRPAGPNADSLNFAEYAAAWIDGRRTRKGEPLRPRTKDHYQSLLEKFLTPEFGHLPLANITPAAVRRWYAKQTSRPTYRAHAYGLLKAIMQTATDDETIETVTSNPCTIRGGGVADRRTRIEPATLEELAVLVESMPERLRAMVLLAAWAQLRFGELVELRRKDVVIRSDGGHRYGVVKVRRGAVRVDGKVVVGAPKTAAGVRDVHLPPHLLPAIEAHLKDHTGPGANALLFPAASGGTLAPASLYTHYYKARDAAGRPDLAFHHLRHTGAVFAAQAGGTLAELMARLGHTTPGAAMRYQHAARGRDAEIAARLSEIAATVPPQALPTAR